MSDHEKQTAFLRQCLRYDDTSNRHTLESSITQLERNDRCLRRALSSIIQLGALALAGFAYSALLLPDFPYNLPRFMTQFLPKMFCALGLASVICIPFFCWFRAAYRRELNLRRDECRHLVASLLESRLGKLGESQSPGTLERQPPALSQGVESRMMPPAAQETAVGKVHVRPGCAP
jgi:hypothetical protein